MDHILISLATCFISRSLSSFNLHIVFYELLSISFLFSHILLNAKTRMFGVLSERNVPINFEQFVTHGIETLSTVEQMIEIILCLIKQLGSSLDLKSSGRKNFQHHSLGLFLITFTITEDAFNRTASILLFISLISKSITKGL